MRHYCGVKIELLEMGDEDTWECEIVHEDGNTIKLEATMEFRPKSGNIPAVGPGTSPWSSTTLASPWDTTTPSTTNTGTNEMFLDPIESLAFTLLVYKYVHKLLY